MNLGDFNMKIEDLIACEWCGSVFLKSGLKVASGWYNTYTVPSYACPNCDEDILDEEEEVEL